MKKHQTKEEMASTLGTIFAFTVDSITWKLLETAMKNGGKAYFEDDTGETREFLSSYFTGLKFRKSKRYLGSYELTVLKEWVEMYQTYGEDWHASHAVLDTLEAYASSAAFMFGVITLDEFKEIMRHYDKGYCLPDADLPRILSTRALCPNMPFRILGDQLVANCYFPDDEENSDTVRDFQLAVRGQFQRWLPPTREEFFEWAEGPAYPGESSDDCDPEEKFIDAFTKALKSGDEYDAAEALNCVQESFYHCGNTQDAVDSLSQNGLIDIQSLKFPENVALEKHIRAVGVRVRCPMLNGRNRAELGISADMVIAEYLAEKIPEVIKRLASNPDFRDGCFDDEDDFEPIDPIRRDTPKVGRNEPCPCGSGKKYKHCCGK